MYDLVAYLRGDTVTNNRRNPGTSGKAPCDSRRRVWSVHAVVIVATALLVAGLAVLGFRLAADASRLKVARLSILSVSMDLVNYSDICGHLPYPVVRRGPAGESKAAGALDAAGSSLYSWRVEIVPYLQSWHGTWDPSQRWDAPSNRQLAELSSFYAFNATAAEGRTQPFPETDLLAITVPGTAFGDGGERPMALKDVPAAEILAVEAQLTGIPWPAPGDFDIRTMPRAICAPGGKGISGRNAGGFHVIFADGWVWQLSDKVPFETLAKFFTTSDAAKHDREQLLGPFKLHRGL